MKRIIATIIALVMLVCCFSIPCMADTSAAISLNVEYTESDGMVNLSGTMTVGTGKYWATLYLLNPGFTRDDIPTHSESNQVFSHCAEITANSDGTFEYKFKHSGEPDIYTLYFTTGYDCIESRLDTRQDTELENNQLEALRGLPTTYEAPSNPDASVKELFLEKVAELPNEMPVVSPRPIEGLLNEVFVDAENGDDDTARGTKQKPYKTIKQALKENPPAEDMVLYLREGTYSVDDALEISEVSATDERPFIISNYKDEEVIISGETEINGAYFENLSDQEVIQRLDPAAIGNIKVLDLEDKYGVDCSNFETSSTHALYVDGNAYTIARWPNGGTTSMKEYKGADAVEGVVDQGGSNNGFEFCVKDLRPFSWVDTGDIWVYGRFGAEWIVNSYNIKKFNPEKRSLRTAQDIRDGAYYSPNNTFYYYNVLEELDSPGEWFLDKETGKLYVYPIADMKDAKKITYVCSNADQMWKLVDCKNVIINGINFKHNSKGIDRNSRGIALNISGDKTYGVVVQNCTFENVAKGVYMEGKYSGVINCKFKDLSDCGIQLIGSGEKPTLTPDRKFAQNNTFYNTGGLRLYGVGQIASHNYISNNINHCIYVDGAECIVEYNEIVASPREIADAGAIYLDGVNMFDRGNHVRYNYIHDMDSTPRSIYFDDMISECYAYGNIIDGSGMQIHTGSDNAVYNNIFLNYHSENPDAATLPGVWDGPVYISERYYDIARNGNDLWKKGSLEYDSFTMNLKNSDYGADEDKKTITGPYAERYPRLKKWAELMYQRIEEYKAAVANGENPIEAAGKSSIYNYYEDGGAYIREIMYPINDAGDLQLRKETLQLNQYLSSARDNYFGNNVFINTSKMDVDLPESDGRWRRYHNGTIETAAENNCYLKSDENPFTNNNYSDENAYETIRDSVQGFESIPFDKIGLMSKEDYPENKGADLITPADTIEVSISANDLSLRWSSVEGAQRYTVEIATDPKFAEGSIVETSDPIYDLSYTVKANLESDKVYYWKVKTEATHKYAAAGSFKFSEVFKFKTFAEGMQDERNSVGVTVYSVDDMKKDNFKVTTYAYNTLKEAKDAIIHIACYDNNNRLIKTKSQEVKIEPDTLTGSYEFNFNAPNTKKIKFFVWSADGNMIPYTFVKTIEKKEL